MRTQPRALPWAVIGSPLQGPDTHENLLGSVLLARPRARLTRTRARWARSRARWVRSHARWARSHARWARSHARLARSRARWVRSHARWARSHARWARSHARWARSRARWARSRARWARSRARLARETAWESALGVGPSSRNIDCTSATAWDPTPAWRAGRESPSAVAPGSITEATVPRPASSPPPPSRGSAGSSPESPRTSPSP